MNTTTPTESSNKPEMGAACTGHHGHSKAGKFYNELIRIVTALFVGVLALMTFLLTIGIQKPHANFSYAMYASIVLLGVNLIAYVFGQMLQSQTDSLKCEVKCSTEEGADLDKAKAKLDSARKNLKVMRIVQQVLFVAVVIAVTCLALATAQFFFSINPAAPAPTGQ